MLDALLNGVALGVQTVKAHKSKIRAMAVPLAGKSQHSVLALCSRLGFDVESIPSTESHTMESSHAQSITTGTVC